MRRTAAGGLEAAACLVGSAALLAAAAGWREPGGTRPKPLALEGFTLGLGGASGERTLDGLAVAPLAGGERATLLRRGFDLAAADWEHAEVRFDGEPGHPYLLWRADERTLGTPLLRHGDLWAAQWLGTRPEWSGRVTALGVGLVGPVPDGVTVEEIRLVPRSAAAARAGALRDWTAVEGLGGHSGNFVIGGSDTERPRWRPAPVAAAWAALALGLHLLWRRLTGARADPVAIAAIVGAAWLLLDARWQVDLLRQHGRTERRYAGLSPERKAAVGEDAALVAFAERVKAALPVAPQPLLVVVKEPEGDDRYLQLRSRYRLLPHDVGPARAYPPERADAPGGTYLVVFAPRDDVGYDEAAGELTWSRDGAAPRRRAAERLLDLPLASLYRVR